MRALRLRENYAGGPDAEHVTDREKGEDNAHDSHLSGLRAGGRKVAMRRHWPDALYAEGAGALRLVVTTGVPATKSREIPEVPSCRGAQRPSSKCCRAHGHPWPRDRKELEVDKSEAGACDERPEPGRGPPPVHPAA